MTIKVIQLFSILVSIMGFSVFLFGVNKLIKKSSRETIEFPNLTEGTREFTVDKAGNYMVLIQGKRWDKFPLFSAAVIHNNGEKIAVKANLQAKESTLNMMTVELYNFNVTEKGNYTIVIGKGKYSFYHNKMNSTNHFNPIDYKLLIRQSHGSAFVFSIIATVLGLIMTVLGIVSAFNPELLIRLMK